jgi:hypothetical protein
MAGILITGPAELKVGPLDRPKQLGECIMSIFQVIG